MTWARPLPTWCRSRRWSRPPRSSGVDPCARAACRRRGTAGCARPRSPHTLDRLVGPPRRAPPGSWTCLRTELMEPVDAWLRRNGTPQRRRLDHGGLVGCLHPPLRRSSRGSNARCAASRSRAPGSGPTAAGRRAAVDGSRSVVALVADLELERTLAVTVGRRSPASARRWPRSQALDVTPVARAGGAGLGRRRRRPAAAGGCAACPTSRRRCRGCWTASASPTTRPVCSTTSGSACSPGSRANGRTAEEPGGSVGGRDHRSIRPLAAGRRLGRCTHPPLRQRRRPAALGRRPHRHPGRSDRVRRSPRLVARAARQRGCVAPLGPGGRRGRRRCGRPGGGPLHRRARAGHGRFEPVPRGAVAHLRAR